MLVVDTREPQFEDAAFTRAYLSRGDYAIIRPDGTCAALIERKTFADYVASMKDKRIKSIETKLLGVADKTYVLLEVNTSVELETMCHGISFGSVLKSCARIEREYGVVILRSSSFENSREILKALEIEFNAMSRDIEVKIPAILQQVVHKSPYDTIIDFLMASMHGIGEKSAKAILDKGSLLTHIMCKPEIYMPKQLNKKQQEQYHAIFDAGSDEPAGYSTLLKEPSCKYLFSREPKLQALTLIQLSEFPQSELTQSQREKVNLLLNTSSAKSCDFGVN